ncbi:peptidase inhibitor family I36 protein [Streptomyces sp. BE20]|uniref:peptidase inhibitor family I36 protein n=1 Tax=Streptomycetaceae TaxID=2062 RepID=UPI002E78CF3F|nr:MULTISPECIES: peptidase inhibitor family I36 protein [unclassified Streptomyces]MED7955032.1 peptidase inhibitor family I36 protein [Streptomyces sp. BE303]MEE1821173.1 peptidase inhibitor family I36 protein [Streptomyces sp. BE20]
MPKNSVRLGLCAAAVIGLIMTAAPSASATTILGIGQGAGACPGNHVCLWSENDYVGATSGSKFGSIASDQNVADMGKLKRDGALWTGMQDTASSVLNNTGSSICFYEHNGYGGLEFRIGPREHWPSVPSWINDRISSFKYC